MVLTGRGEIGCRLRSKIASQEKDVINLTRRLSGVPGRVDGGLVDGTNVAALLITKCLVAYALDTS